MQDFGNILSPLCNEFNRFNNTESQILDYINHMALKSFLEIALLRENDKIY